MGDAQEVEVDNESHDFYEEPVHRESRESINIMMEDGWVIQLDRIWDDTVLEYQIVQWDNAQKLKQHGTICKLHEIKQKMKIQSFLLQFRHDKDWFNENKHLLAAAATGFGVVYLTSSGD